MDILIQCNDLYSRWMIPIHRHIQIVLVHAAWTLILVNFEYKFLKIITQHSNSVSDYYLDLKDILLCMMDHVIKQKNYKNCLVPCLMITNGSFLALDVICLWYHLFMNFYYQQDFQPKFIMVTIFYIGHWYKKLIF